jgi:hypothetical protein
MDFQYLKGISQAPELIELEDQILGGNANASSKDKLMRFLFHPIVKPEFKTLPSILFFISVIFNPFHSFSGPHTVLSHFME